MQSTIELQDTNVARLRVAPNDHYDDYPQIAEAPILADNGTNTSVAWTYPDGGRQAWSCVMGSFFLMFPSFGFEVARMCLFRPISRTNEVLIV